MTYVYLVTTDKSFIPSNPIAMVDGTVPGWTPRECDLHFDHHLTGEKVQIFGIPDDTVLPQNAVFITTMVDADAQAAAAWLQLLQMKLDPAVEYEARAALVAIAYDCDHLGLPTGSEWDVYREFAAKAVAALKESGNALAVEMGLPAKRNEWNEHQKIRYASEAFKRGTEWLVDACLGKRNFPGFAGEAGAYFAKMESQRSQVYENCSLYRGCTIFDQRSFDEYVDPRLAVEWARENNAPEPITLTVRDGSKQPNAIILDWAGDMYSYTLGSVPLHQKGSPMFSDRSTWQALQNLELRVRADNQQATPHTQWGGRNEVGGSSWRDPMIASPQQVIDAVLDSMSKFQI